MGVAEANERAGCTRQTYGCGRAQCEYVVCGVRRPGMGACAEEVRAVLRETDGLDGDHIRVVRRVGETAARE